MPGIWKISCGVKSERQIVILLLDRLIAFGIESSWPFFCIAVKMGRKYKFLVMISIFA